MTTNPDGRGQGVRARWLTGLALTLGAIGVGWVLWPEPMLVDAAQVASGPMQVSVDDQGEARSHDRFLVAAPVAGRVARIELHDGDAVAAGQVLARIAPVPLSRRETDEIEARVAAARAVEREVQEAVRGAEQELAQAGREAARVRKLADQGFMGPQAAEQAASRVAQATSTLDGLRFRARAAAADARAAGAALSAASAAQRGSAGLVEIRAPSPGRILRIHDPSDRVVSAGAPLMTLGDLAQLEIVIELLSSEAVRVSPGMPVLIEGWGGDRTLRATVRRIEPYAVTKVSALGIEEKRVNVIADFVDAPGPIGDGYRVTARIVVWSAERVLKVPASALFRCNNQWCAFVIDEGRARRRLVETGQRNSVEAEVLKGVTEGQWVIRHPDNALDEGARVRVRR